MPPLRRLRLRLFPRAESAILRGHPWVYADGIRTQDRAGLPGELAVIYDRRDRFLALGFFDPDSPIRVRILQLRPGTEVNSDFWQTRIEQARARRLEAKVFTPDTNGGRWINGESDGMPGLVADQYGGTLVVKLYSVAWLSLWDSIEPLLRQALRPEFLLLRLSRNLKDSAQRDWGIEEGFRGTPGQDTVIFQETGLSFEAPVRLGQKTGFFLDQRENRRRVETLAADRSVLNAFSYSGGFSLYAARGGARSVTDLDLSSHALDSAERNFALNASLPAVRDIEHRRIQADAFDWLHHASPGAYDLAIVDPPSLAPREANRAAAIEGYSALARGGLRVLRRGGVLVAASCSSHVGTEEFFTTVRRTADRSSRRWRELWTSEHAPDHPATFPEASYLKAICLELLD